ncbi:hypothetical protein FS837_003179 [Tulasnella sp. UAMH 9824]|nr:hypothetical protein FS837_003179 [Tulasnella sp. UAMH 9824]
MSLSPSDPAPTPALDEQKPLRLKEEDTRTKREGSCESQDDIEEFEDPESAQAQLERLVCKYAIVKGQRDQATSERLDMDAQVQFMSQEKRKAEGDLGISEAKRRKLEEDRDIERNKVMELHEVCDDLSEQLENLKKERDAQAERASKRVKELENLLSAAIPDTLLEQKTTKSLQEQVEAMNRERDALQMQLQAEQEKARNWEAEVTILKEKYDQIEEDVSKIQEHYKKKCSELERCLSDAENEVSRTKSQLVRERHIARGAELDCDMYRDKWRRAVDVMRDAMDEVERL